MFKYNNCDGFTLAEVCTAMIVLSFIIVATIPLMTSRKLSFGMDKSTQNCINLDKGNLSSTNCLTAINNCKITNANNSCNNLIYYANSGTTDLKISALKVLQETCNQGGAVACNYFINLCVSNSSECNITTTTPASGLRSFLLKSNSDSTFGKLFLEKTLKDYYADNVTNIVKEVDDDCCAGSVLTSACNIKSVFTCP